MRLHVVYDASGKILWGERLPQDGENGWGAPVVRDGQAVAKLTVPQEYSHRELLELCQLLRVELKGDEPEFVVSSTAKARTKKSKPGRS